MLVLLFSLWFYFQEVIFFTVNLKHYVMQIETWVKFASIILAMILPKLMENNTPSLSEDSADWARHTATMAVLTCWLYMVFLLSRFPKWGCYVLMFRKVFSNVVKVRFSEAYVNVVPVATMRSNNK